MRNDNLHEHGSQPDPSAYFQHFLASREPPSPSARRPWSLAVLAQVCAGLVIAGSLGPWMYYERVSEVAPYAWTLYGIRTDGAFTLLFAIIAFIALPFALIKRDSEVVAWIAVATLGLCAVTGLLEWLMFAPPEVSVEVGKEGNIRRVEWGMKLVGLAGLAGTIVTFVIARQLNRD